MKKSELGWTESFYSLQVGKIYNTAIEINTQKGLYASPEPIDQTYIGSLKPKESFVVIEVDKFRTHNWTKILTASGAVGWCSWDSGRLFVEEICQ